MRLVLPVRRKERGHKHVGEKGNGDCCVGTRSRVHQQHGWRLPQDRGIYVFVFDGPRRSRTALCLRQGSVDERSKDLC